MSLKPTRRIPRRFTRPITKKTRKMVGKRYKRHKVRHHELLKRLVRRWKQGFSRQAKAYRIFFVYGCIALLICAVGFLLFSPVLEVREVRIKRMDERLDIDKIQQVLAPLFGHRILFLSERDVVEILEKSVVDLSEVQVNKQYPSTISVTISLDPLVAELKVDDPTRGSTHKDSDDISEGIAEVGSGVTTGRDYLTSKGVYVHVQSGKPSVPLPLLRLVDWGVRPLPGVPLISTELLKKMRFAEQILFQQFGMDVSERTIFLRAQEFHLTVNDLTLWFDIRSSIEVQIERYRTFLQNVESTEAEEYIDLRLSDRVVYR